MEFAHHLLLVGRRANSVYFAMGRNNVHDEKEIKKAEVGLKF